MAFNIRDKNFRIPVEETIKLKQTKKKQHDYEEAKKGVADLRIKKLEQSIEKNKDNIQQLERDKRQLKKMNEKMKDILRKSEEKSTGNSRRTNRDKNLKITFENIEKMHYSEFNNKGEDDFRP